MQTRILLAALGLICLPFSSRAENIAPPLAVAVFDIETPDPALKPEAGNIGVLLSTYLSTQDSLILVERQQLESILGEQSLGASGLINPQSAAKVGQLTGAKVILLSRMFIQGQNLTLVTKMIGTETGRVFAEVGTLPSGEKQSDALRAFANKIAGIIRQNGNDLVARPEPADERIARLAKLLAGRKSPTVSVSIPEQHISHRVIDPAAETEIANTLGQLGFVLVIKSAAAPAAYQITGEAFSEQAVRRGDFTSCRARVELKVVETATGRIILQDRQTEVGVDLAESLAAKNALQKAGAQLADRIVAQFAALK